MNRLCARNAMVLGYVSEGEAKAYPHPILDWHENMSLVLKDLYAFKGNLISLDSLNAMTDIFRDLNMKLKLSSY